MNTQKAEKMGIRDGEKITISAEKEIIEAPVHLNDDTDPNTIAMYAGQGHWSMGKNASGTGVNAFPMLPPNSNNKGVKVEKTGVMDAPLYLQPTQDQHERKLLRDVDLEALTSGTAQKEKINWPLPKGYDKKHDMYEPHEHDDHRWGMVIDLQRCIGCKACEAACYAENNIITVGKKNLEEGREMSWLKVTPYKIDKERMGFLPVPCQHCDNAPCEPVCPVFASVHTEEGLNAQIYNRCIGTRYCSNNCPYKVRRFNWVRHKHEYPTNLQLNPEVTVRDHGVMEKCTFCVQRIKSVEQKAKIEDRPVRDQEVQPACVQTCPTDAIAFGDLHDKNSRVRKLYEDRRRYQLLAELNTKPAVIYLKKINIKT
jgi:molybdopterin-containing oxidoreductase family iron-sulfur binding subunit